MTEPIFDPDYWRDRLEHAKEIHHAIFRCPLDQWKRIEERHREILARCIKPGDSILDAGCGWGRLLELLPPTWMGMYLGVDISPEFIGMATANDHGVRISFEVGDLRNLDFIRSDKKHVKYDWAICISMRPMITRNMGGDVWLTIEKELHRVCRQILLLEYDTVDGGVVK